jgi:hypothetical protein
VGSLAQVLPPVLIEAPVDCRHRDDPGGEALSVGFVSRAVMGLTGDRSFEYLFYAVTGLLCRSAQLCAELE